MLHRGMPNCSEFPRHMLGIGYCAERDPCGECSHLGLGKHRHVFSADARAAFAGPTPAQVLVDRNVSFVTAPVDHFGNTAPPPGEVNGGVIESGPYAGGSKGLGSRFDFWLPDAPLGAAPPLAPPWLASLCAGRPLAR